MRLLLTLAVAVLAAALPAQTPPHATGTVKTPDVALAYETYGTLASGMPVIAINGGPGLSHAYMVQNDVWQRIAAHHLVVLYDQRGTGLSRPLAPNASQAMDTQVADLEALRQSLHLDRIALVGDSYGGFLAMAYASAHPQHVARLVLSDSPPPSFKSMTHLLPDVFPDIEEQSTGEEKKLAATDPAAAAQAGLIAHFRMIFYSPEKLETYLAHCGDLGFVPSVAQAVGASAHTLDMSANLPGFHFPTLVLTGRYDMNVAPINAWRMAHQIPGARIVFFEKSGHLPSYEEPDKYVQVLEDFLAS